jgi:hypothetical protein
MFRLKATRGAWKDVVVSQRFLQQNFYGRDFSVALEPF